jgi:hypothetical protein
VPGAVHERPAHREGIGRFVNRPSTIRPGTSKALVARFVARCADTTPAERGAAGLPCAPRYELATARERWPRRNHWRHSPVSQTTSSMLALKIEEKVPLTMPMAMASTKVLIVSPPKR